MDRLAALQTFVKVAELRSFAGAARQLHISAAVASRAIRSLEDDLGASLFHRTTRSVTLTPEGAAYLAQCRVALQTLDEAHREFQGGAEPRGLLVVNAPVVFGRLHVLPIVSRLIRKYPALRVRLTLTDQVARIAEEGVDVAVRAGELSDSSLIAIRLTEVRRVLVASPAYIANCGQPNVPDDLLKHDLIGFDGFALGDEWRFAGEEEATVRFSPRLVTNSVEAAIDAASEGLGIARPLSYQVASQLKEQNLVRLLEAFEPPATPINIVFPENRRGSGNVRAFIDAAKMRFETSGVTA